MRSLILLIPLLPLIGFLLNISWGKQLPKKISGGIGVLAVLMSFLLVVYGWLQSSGSESTIDYTYFKWIETSAFSINFGFQLDNLSFLMMSIITGVGFLIHLYSDGYMHKDDGYYRFFAYLNLFIFFMLLLVMGSNLLITYIGWEGVGLCSYLLIGFWFKNHEYNDAAKKAFIVNRIGDLGFIVGIFFCLLNYKTIEYAALNELAAGSIQIGSAVVTTITLALFFGSTAKSAQIPLYTWLPDAMAGPTPVSALIHAATMVTAGIYMITRLNGLFLAAPFTLDVILVVGTATALVAAIIATRQNDIKKVLAYSTVSQLGFMFAALGAGAFVSGMFHLTTHAFFKALLFLGSGSVIHAMSGEQDIRNMGGLKSLKVT
ncbi:MAG TPA: NADH-quinone oxidoreductase subunit L, partial [Saprospiraceae bacterium]|nr:NADH-quinone oxidoreductase subunit L [Saprospiraceae bacterium]